VSWTKGRHSTKFGVYMEHSARNVSVYSTYNTAGTYWFGSDTANPADTGYALSNLLYGTVQAYGEDNKKQTNHARYNQLEWFAQDTWKISRTVTVDLGMRFQVIQPAYSKGATLAPRQRALRRAGSNRSVLDLPGTASRGQPPPTARTRSR